MKRIGILSDTHGYFNPALRTFFKDCDELWHAGDWGSVEVADEISSFRPLKGVYGNIDNHTLRLMFPEVLIFSEGSLKVCLLHIGGYPGRYSPRFRQVLRDEKPDIMVCGHSHILKVMRDPAYNLMHFNPGAAGDKGFHRVCTALRMKTDGKRLTDLEVWEQLRK